MRISHRARAQCIAGTFLLLVMAGLGLGGVAPARAQVLAQKNWAGSGVTVDPWWRRAVFYRVDPAKFQDSDGDGKGDLAGLTQRLDYLQMLGVDALILRAQPAAASAAGVRATGLNATGGGTSGIALDGFDDLVRAAVGSHVRVLVEMGAPASQQSDGLYVAEARQWLNQGAAGIYIPTQAVEKVDGAGHIAMLLQQLRQLTDSFPGERVLLADAPAAEDVSLLNALQEETQLTASVPLDTTTPTAASLRGQLMTDLGSASASATSSEDTARPASPPPAIPASAKPAPSKASATKSETTRVPAPRRRRHSARRAPAVGARRTAAQQSNPLLLAGFIPDRMEPGQRVAVERTLAVMLLVSRAAVLLEYGQEIGLKRTGNGSEPLMQWSPRNVTPKPEPTKRDEKAEASASMYKGFHPYVKPLPRNLFPPPAMPVVVESDEPQAVAVDPNSVPGFTAGPLDSTLLAVNGATANVVLEQYDSRSLLSLYRQLIQMHHENATVRNGSETLLDRDSLDALVWVRRPPANSRTSASVVAACNLSGTAVGLGDVGIRGVRTMVSSPPGGDGGILGPGMVWVGEGR